VARRSRLRVLLTAAKGQFTYGFHCGSVVYETGESRRVFGALTTVVVPCAAGSCGSWSGFTHKGIDMATHVEGSTRNRTDAGHRSVTRVATETKHALKTTEFWAYLAAVAGVLVASWIVTSGNGSTSGDAFDASRAWMYITILTVGYMVSRGSAKAGSREPRIDDDHR
jgi:hypothetical protein